MVPLFKNSLHIDMYNDKFFRPEFIVSIRLNDTPSNSTNCVAFQPQDNLSTDKSLFKD